MLWSSLPGFARGFSSCLSRNTTWSGTTPILALAASLPGPSAAPFAVRRIDALCSLLKVRADPRPESPAHNLSGGLSGSTWRILIVAWVTLLQGWPGSETVLVHPPVEAAISSDSVGLPGRCNQT